MDPFASTAIVLFLIGFVSDLVVQQIGKHVPNANAILFTPFWKKYGPIGAAIIAGCITLIIGGLFLTIAMMAYNYYGLDTKTWSFVLFSTALAFVFGVIIDVQTNYNDWIPSLRKWYDGVGATDAALWSGGLSFAFTAFIATSFWKYFA